MQEFADRLEFGAARLCKHSTSHLSQSLIPSQNILVEMPSYSDLGQLMALENRLFCCVTFRNVAFNIGSKAPNCVFSSHMLDQVVVAYG